jgi:hypothetical protein
MRSCNTDDQTGFCLPWFVGRGMRGVDLDHDDFTLLIVIHFTRTDLEEEEWDLGNG